MFYFCTIIIVIMYLSCNFFPQKELMTSGIQVFYYFPEHQKYTNEFYLELSGISWNKRTANL